MENESPSSLIRVIFSAVSPFEVEVDLPLSFKEEEEAGAMVLWC